MAEENTDLLGILSIVFAFIMPLAGLILGIVGYSNRKKAGLNPVLSKVGIIINIVFMLIGVLALIAYFGLIAFMMGA